MTSFIWTINDLERTTADGFVILAKFGCTASDGVNTTGMTSAACWTQDPDKAVIPYEDLTEEIVLGWIKEAAPAVIPYEDLTEEIVLGWIKEAAPDTEANLQVTLDLLAAPTQAVGMPWGA